MAEATTKNLTIFSYCGKNYIGYVCTIGSAETNKPNFVGIGTTYSNVYVVQAPAEISYEVSITTDATADLVSKVMPLFPGAFYSGAAQNIYFAFPKNDVVVSTIKDTAINDTIKKQYLQLTKLPS